MIDFIVDVLLFFIGLISGTFIAAGLYAFLIIIGTITRLVSRTETAKQIGKYEDVIVVGATCGNLIYVFEYSPPLNIIGLIIFGGFSGVFVGCLASALAETVQAIPVFSKRIKLKVGMPYIIISLGLGKCLATFYQLFINWSPK
ncbi:MAG TPA: stage V sporulation protein AB [Clostridiales bacterium]|nr:stage V sporulation protein AB [Clostridiales bacterium]